MPEIIAQEDKMRLDRFLLKHCPDESRANIQRWIEQELVQVNGQSAQKSGHKIRAGDHILWRVPENKPLEGVLPEEIALDICYEDAHLLVINKAVGMVVHPGAGHSQGTLVNALLHHCEQLSGIGGVERPGIVHRLDKDTSGLLVVAKDDISHRRLSAQLQSREMKRSYYALCEQNMSEDSGTIEAPIDRHPKQRQQMAVVKGGRFARTHWRVCERFQLGTHFYTWLQLDLDTGRTHQIRVHLKHIKHPLVGDPVYGSKRKHPFKVQRPLLHAWRLKFRHPHTEEALSFEAELPSDFQRVLESLSSRS